jgi:Cu(I)-responsive transcriptional regulator
MNIGAVAKASGVSAKMIRHYEQIGLIGHSPRTEAGYRQYQERDLHTLKFIRSARDLGFSLEQIHQLLSLWYDEQRSSAEVKQLAESHLSDLDARIQALTTMRDALVRLSESCCGDDRPDCPILEGLAGHGPASSSPPQLSKQKAQGV